MAPFPRDSQVSTMKECPSCGVSVPDSAARCKDCFHDFLETPPKKSSPVALLAAMAGMAVIAAGVFWYVGTLPTEERILVDKATQSIVWTRQFRDTVETERLDWNKVAKLEYLIASGGRYAISAITLGGDRKLVQESRGEPIRVTAEQYARLMDKPLEIVDETTGFHKMSDEQ